MRQVCHSPNNPKAELDLVLFLNGIAVATAELKSNFTQSVPNPEGFATAYLWDEVWARESWLDILHRYLIGKRDDKKQLRSVIFPRYHQLDATRKLVADVLAQGPGQRYLIQHSAGSGKTNSIAWTAHFLANMWPNWLITTSKVESG